VSEYTEISLWGQERQSAYNCSCSPFFTGFLYFWTPIRNYPAILNKGGQIWLVDRGSAFGTIVNGKDIGGKDGINRISVDSHENQVVIGPVGSKLMNS
jgi:hypothetical protein